MFLFLERFRIGDDYILGRLYHAASEEKEKIFLCYTLEPPYREKFGAIPVGIYDVINTYSPKFGKTMPLVCNVEGRSGIRFHCGNFPKDTRGCILVGESFKDDGRGSVTLLSSRFEFVRNILCFIKKYKKIKLSVQFY